MTRAEAKALGLTRYLTGLPCKHGHIAERRTGDGSCIECSAIKSRLWQLNNPERAREKSKAWKRRNADKLREKAAEKYHVDPQSSRAAALAAYYRNRERRMESARRWKAENREQVLAYARAWAEANKERRAANERNRNARKRASVGTHTAEDVAKLMRLQRGRCAACRLSLRASGHHVDHVVPLALGGGNGPDNLQLLCPKCNLKKRARDPIEWAQSIGRLL